MSNIVSFLALSYCRWGCHGVLEILKTAHRTALIWCPCLQTSAALFRCQEAPSYNIGLYCISCDHTAVNWSSLQCVAVDCTTQNDKRPALSVWHTEGGGYVRPQESSISRRKLHFWLQVAKSLSVAQVSSSKSQIHYRYGHPAGGYERLTKKGKSLWWKEEAPWFIIVWFFDNTALQNFELLRSPPT